MNNAVIATAISAWVATMGLASPFFAQAGPVSGMPPNTSMTARPAAPLVEGEVRKVDKDTRKITLKHADIPNLEMPGMTMVFQVKDSAMLDLVKAGDKVRFAAIKEGGAIVIIELQPAK